MRKSILILLVLSAVLVADTEARWFRKLINKGKAFVKKAVDKINDFLDKNKHWTSLLSGRKRRSVDGVATTDQTAAELQMEEKLMNLCSSLSPGDSVDLTVVTAAFTAADADGDNSLNPDELDRFQADVEIYGECIEIEQRKRK